ncbi:uncharacterized protein EI90DRAFT_3082077 [Cantharellus anzutake]|uniref:uncharacterized protein n=1 Tax=Cantharellus anzutake TaxID=1750568 RepID=UPI001906D0E8|nr:uncharacterized protein EI90DRAFT_3082077 [Cantharellus anzutake]KAF8319469.1 hypothetical protein EI90DRAFT_3082077 [Cantharellus anzutake]
MSGKPSDHTGQDPSAPTQPEGSASRDSNDAGSGPSDLAEDNSRSGSDEATHTENHTPVPAEDQPNPIGLGTPNTYTGYPGASLNGFTPYPVDQAPPPRAGEWVDEHGVNGFPAHPVDQILIDASDDQRS